MSKRDYYEILSVSRTATDQELKTSYRKLAVKYHPDKNPGDHEAENNFKEAAEAYSILSDKEQRARYDRFGHEGVSGAAGANWGASGFGGGIGEEFLGEADRGLVLAVNEVPAMDGLRVPIEGGGGFCERGC